MKPNYLETMKCYRPSDFGSLQVYVPIGRKPSKRIDPTGVLERARQYKKDRGDKIVDGVRAEDVK